MAFTKEELNKALEKVKIELMMRKNTVFYTTILFSLKLIWAEDDHPVWGGRNPTAAVDGVYMWMNPGFFMKLTVEERLGLLLHEVLHVAFNHMLRLGKRDPEVWNYAGDYIINNTLLRAGYQLPTPRLADFAYEKYNSEQLYDILYKKHKTIKISLMGIGLDILHAAKNDPKNVHDIEQAVANILTRAVMQSRASKDAPGSIPGNVERAIDELINPKLPWNVILQNHMNAHAKDDYTMHRPNRRFSPEHYLPCAHSVAVDNIVTAFDASCSVAPHEFSHYVHETMAIQETMMPEEITLISFDTQIQLIQKITHETDILKSVKFKGGGGTDLNDLMNWIAKNQPKLVLIFTDGYFTMPEFRTPGTDIIWIIHDNPEWTAEYGTVIHFEMPKEQHEHD